jgi:hypothetical protein
VQNILKCEEYCLLGCTSWSSIEVYRRCGPTYCLHLKSRIVRRASRVLYSSISWDITPCIPLKVNRPFGGICRLHIQCRRIIKPRNQHVASSFMLVCSLFLFRPWNGGDIFSETSVYFQWTARRYIAEVITVHYNGCENLKHCKQCIGFLLGFPSTLQMEAVFSSLTSSQFYRLYGVTSQKIILSISVAVRTSSFVGMCTKNLHNYVDPLHRKTFSILNVKIDISRSY